MANGSRVSVGAGRHVYGRPFAATTSAKPTSREVAAGATLKLPRHPLSSLSRLGAVCFFWGTTYLGIRMSLEAFPPLHCVART